MGYGMNKLKGTIVFTTFSPLYFLLKGEYM